MLRENILKRNIFKGIALLIVGLMLMGIPMGVEGKTNKGMRGVWVASVFNIDFPSKQNLSVEQMKAELDQIVNTAAKSNINNIFFQVRPKADALYKSSVFPWSEYLTGKQGVAPANNFDPLKYLISKAKAKGIKVHAWINPFRVTLATNSKTKKNHDLSKLSVNNPARKHPGYVVKHSDGGMYFDPGQPKVRDLIVKGVKELVKNYDIASVHLDDYFYPDAKFNDAKSFKKYGKKFKSKADWRRNNVNTLIKRIHAVTKASKKKVQFGVSPGGVWANKESNANGSNTYGDQSYLEHYADTRKWMLENMVDYLIPQIYWEIGNKYADYKTLVDWWSNVAKRSKAKLYIGMAAYRIGDATQGDVWQNAKTIEDELKLNKQMPYVKGWSFFGFENIAKNKLGLQTLISKY